MAVWRAMPSPLRLAIVGLGRIATAHVAAIERAGGVVVVAGADPDPAARLVFRGRDLPVVRDPAGLPPVDAAVVTVPTGAHLAVLRELARAGVPEVLMEKPLVATREELASARRCPWRCPRVAAPALRAGRRGAVGGGADRGVDGGARARGRGAPDLPGPLPAAPR